MLEEQNITPPSVYETKISDNSQWYPPMSQWRFSLLMICSLTIYSLFFVFRTYKDLNANVDCRLSPGWHTIGFMIPILNILLFYQFVKQIELIGVDPKKLPKSVMVALTFYYALIGALSFSISEEFVFLGLVGSALPWLYLRHRLNRRLSGFEYQCWRMPPNRFSMAQKILVSFGLIFISLILVKEYSEVSKYYGANSISSGTQIIDKKNQFNLTITQKGWKRAKTGAVAEDAKLELVSPENDAWAIIYVIENVNYTIDDQVDFRRNEISDNDSQSRLKFEENRQFLPGLDMVPVSYAKYTIEGVALTEEWFVATILSDNKIIEFIAYQTDKNIDKPLLEALVKSLSIIQQEEYEK